MNSQTSRPGTPSSSPLTKNPPPATSSASIQSESPVFSPPPEAQSVPSTEESAPSKAPTDGSDKVNYLRVTSAVLSIDHENADLKRKKATVMEHIERIGERREEAQRVFEEAKDTFEKACAEAAAEIAQEEQEIVRIDAVIDENETTKEKLQLATLVVNRELAEAIKKHGGPN